MSVKDVLIIGAGIAGCSVALALAKRNIPVTLVTSQFDQRTYHASFAKSLHLDQTFPFQEGTMCPRAWEHIQQMSSKSVEELLGTLDPCPDVHKKLQEQLKEMPQVEWLSHHTALDLLTLDGHSLKKADMHKKPACVGAYVYHQETGQVETILAKETILATGGASSLFLYSTHLPTIIGEGWAMAYRAGVRLLNLNQIQFYPVALFEKDKPSLPLPLELLKMGGKLLSPSKDPIARDSITGGLASLLYQEILDHKAEHLWLDLTPLDAIEVKEKFPFIDNYCLSRGYNIAKDPLPIVPAVHYTCGGIAVDRLAQTNLHRLRAIGEVACTGLFYDSRNEEVSILESLTWAYGCAEDIAKQIEKFIYYFPPVREWQQEIKEEKMTLSEDWDILRRVMWSYAGSKYDQASLKKGLGLLHEMERQCDYIQPPSIESFHFLNALQVSQLIIHSLLRSIR